MDLKVEPQAMSHWRDGDPCNRRKPIMTIPTVQDQSLSPWRPGAAHEGLKHIAPFIDQHDIPTMVTGLFSLLPIPPCARRQSPPRLAPAPVAPASGSPSHPLEDATKQTENLLYILLNKGWR